MKFINKVFIVLMAFGIATTILAFCLDQTLLKADFVATRADKSGIYTDLAQQLPQQLSAGTTNSPAIQAALTRVVTPPFIQARFDVYLHTLEAAYRHGSALPPLDLTEVIPQAETLGVRLSDQDVATLSHNLVIQPGNIGRSANQTSSVTTNSQVSSQIYRRAAQTKWVLLLGTLVLATLGFVTAGHRRWRALGQGFFGATAWLLGYYTFFRLAPSVAAHQLKTAKSFSLSDSVGRLVTLAAGGLAHILLYAAAITTVAGALLWLVGLIMPRVGHRDKPTDSRTPLPDVFHKD